MQKIIAISSGDILDWFAPVPDFKCNVSFLPDDLLTMGQWVSDTKTNFVYRELVPAMLFFCNGNVLAVKEKGQYRIWFGDRITQNDIQSYSTLHALASRTLKEERITRKTVYDFIGYATWKQGRSRNEFLVVYAAMIQKKQLLKNECWLAVQKIHSFYYALDPLSRKLFDVFYESPVLSVRYLSVSQKINKTVDTHTV